MSEVRILHGDALEMLRTLDSESVQTCVTSPPYFGLRMYLKPDHPDYAKQIGLEPTFDCLGWARALRCGMCFICRLTAVFREVRRVLKRDGTLWLNIGDSYANPDKGGYQNERTKNDSMQASNLAADFVGSPNRQPQGWLKPKDMMLAPERLALSLQADGWYLRSRIIWAKPATMPESVRDRPTKSHEHIWLLSKSERYFYSKDAREPLTRPNEGARATKAKFGGAQKFAGAREHSRLHSGNEYAGTPDGMRNWRDVWSIGPEPYKGEHFATFPSEIPRRAIIAGSRAGDTVLDPFAGTGTTGRVAAELGRHAILIELAEHYERDIRARTTGFTVGLPLGAPA